jgi:putative transcriptional regulator
MTKRNIFSELVEGFDALQSEREGKLTLRQVKVEPKPVLVLGPQEVRTLENREPGRRQLPNQ